MPAESVPTQNMHCLRCFSFLFHFCWCGERICIYNIIGRCYQISTTVQLRYGLAFEDVKPSLQSQMNALKIRVKNFFCNSIRALQQRWENTLISEGIVFKNNFKILMGVDFFCFFVTY